MVTVTSLLHLLASLPPWLVLAAVFAFPAAEAALLVGLFVPGEVAVLVGGLVAHTGALPLWSVVACAVAGAVVGDQIGFLLGRRYGDRLLDRMPRRVGRGPHVAAGLDLIRRRGAVAVVLGRFAAALRALVPGLAGMSGMRRLPFTVANVVGGVAWASLVAVVGYAAAASLRVAEQRLGLAGLVVSVVLVGGLVVVMLRRRRSEPDHASAG